MQGTARLGAGAFEASKEYYLNKLSKACMSEVCFSRNDLIYIAHLHKKCRLLFHLQFDGLAVRRG